MLKKNAQFIKNELELDRLYALNERANAENYQIISFCVMNIRFLETYPLANCDDDTQLELLTLRGDYYLSLFKALSAIKNPTQEDVSDRLKYREIAYEYHPVEVEKIEQEFQLKEEKLNLDHDFSFALYLNELEKKSEPIEEFEQKNKHPEEIEQKENCLEELEQNEKHSKELEQNEEFVLLDESKEKVLRSEKVLPLMQEDVKRKYHHSLFDWAKNLQPEALERYINKIIDKQYTPLLSTFSFRQRTEPVKEYLKVSKQEHGDNRLAYILSSGSQEDGALNKLLVEGLTPLMLRKYSIPSINLAIQDKSFKQSIAGITRDVVFFAKNDKRFTHPYSDTVISSVYKAIYDWVDTLTEDSFQSLVKSSLKQYESKTWGGYWSTSKRLNIETYLKKNGNAQVLALIFINELNELALSECLFVKIVNAIKKEIISGDYPKMKHDLEYKLIAEFNLEEHKDFYIANLRTHHETLAAAARHSDSAVMSYAY
ncbi:hypothetical protein Lgra_0557 [Legionella gratiana]|uniref:Uncharacterized protein n=1 Tax=Legionella gratiana TaxID=45066 RepID=A0A378J2G5_9GAMM|nr:hypothetical protein [Legionella gratiana]KTD14526.1 hypothetical protein Lgra_0557 [Legionella gratiana]STX41933.1 Uncharacterised protein [Legionella gratiana]